MTTAPLDKLGGFSEGGGDTPEIVFADLANFYFCRH